MNEVTLILQAVNRGDSTAASRLLPAVYDELRRLAERKMARESPGHTLNATALVHEAYLRLINEERTNWENRALFFAAAAEAMRRILIERARRRSRIKHGGGRRHLSLDDAPVIGDNDDPADTALSLLALNDALESLDRHNRRMAEVVKLRFFAGLTTEQVAEVLGVNQRTVQRDWLAAKAWLGVQMQVAGPETTLAGRSESENASTAAQRNGHTSGSDTTAANASESLTTSDDPSSIAEVTGKASTGQGDCSVKDGDRNPSQRSGD
ncbi:MAG: ECF-type sigma factor [Planctomycetota bacterium]